MTKTTIAAAVIGALVAGAGVGYYYQGKQVPEVGAATEITTLKLNAAQQGEITSRSLMSYSDGARSEVFEFEAEADTNYKVRISGPLTAKMALYKNNRLLSTKQPNEEKARASDDYFYFSVTQPGTYTLAISGSNNSSFGPFVVEVEELQPYREAITAGTKITEWSAGQEHAQYTVTVEEEGFYRFDMRDLGDGIDPYLQLESEGEVLFTDDDGGERYDARIRAYLRPGSYTLVAGSSPGYGEFNGSYEIEMQKIGSKIEVNVEEGQRLAIDGTEYATLLQGDQVQRFSFDLEHDDEVTFSLSGTGGATFFVQDSGPRALSAGEDEQWTVPLAKGTHHIMLQGDSKADALVQWSIQTQGAIGVSVDTHALRAGDEVLAECQPNYAFKTHVFEITQAGGYTLDLQSADFDSYLLVYDADGELIASDDDGGDNYDARIERDFHAGKYLALVRDFNRSCRGGQYRFSINAK